MKKSLSLAALGLMCWLAAGCSRSATAVQPDADYPLTFAAAAAELQFTGNRIKLMLGDLWSDNLDQAHRQVLAGAFEAGWETRALVEVCVSRNISDRQCADFLRSGLSRAR